MGYLLKRRGSVRNPIANRTLEAEHQTPGGRPVLQE
jgi:hypothetical protein